MRTYTPDQLTPGAIYVDRDGDEVVPIAVDGLNVTLTCGGAECKIAFAPGELLYLEMIEWAPV